jgi:hypothetical protein
MFLELIALPIAGGGAVTQVEHHPPHATPATASGFHG